MWVGYQTVQRVFFVGPCVVRYFVGDKVFSQLGWGNSCEYRKEMCGGGFHASGYDPHGIIQGYVQLFGMGIFGSLMEWYTLRCCKQLQGLLFVGF